MYCKHVNSSHWKRCCCFSIMSSIRGFLSTKSRVGRWRTYINLLHSVLSFSMSICLLAFLRAFSFSVVCICPGPNERCCVRSVKRRSFRASGKFPHGSRQGLSTARCIARLPRLSGKLLRGNAKALPCSCHRCLRRVPTMPWASKKMPSYNATKTWPLCFDSGSGRDVSNMV